MKGSLALTVGGMTKEMRSMILTPRKRIAQSCREWPSLQGHWDYWLGRSYWAQDRTLAPSHCTCVSKAALGKAGHHTKGQWLGESWPRVSTYLGVISPNVSEKLVNETSNQGPGCINSRNELRYNLVFTKIQYVAYEIETTRITLDKDQLL